MSFDMGSIGTANGFGLTNGQTVIAKTGTTNLSQSAFFLGATPRYAMAVGMFVSKPHCPPRLESLCTSTQALAFAPPAGVQTLFGVGGLAGYGGQWNLVPPLPKPKPQHQQCDNGNGNPFRCRNQNGNQPPVICVPGSPIPCPTTTPTLPAIGGGGGGGAGGAGTVGGAAAGGVVATGLTVTMLPAGARRWRSRRRQRGPGAGRRKS